MFVDYPPVSYVFEPKGKERGGGSRLMEDGKMGVP